MTEPSRPVVLHVEEVGLVHRVNRQRRRDAVAFVTALPVAHVGERSSTRCPPRLVVEIVVVGDLRGRRIFAVGQTRALQMVDLTIQFLLAPLELLQLLQTFPRGVANGHFLILQLLAFARHHASCFASILALCLHIHLLLLLHFQFVFLAKHA